MSLYENLTGMTPPPVINKSYPLPNFLEPCLLRYRKKNDNIIPYSDWKPLVSQEVVQKEIVSNPDIEGSQAVLERTVSLSPAVRSVVEAYIADTLSLHTVHGDVIDMVQQMAPDLLGSLNLTKMLGEIQKQLQARAIRDIALDIFICPEVVVEPVVDGNVKKNTDDILTRLLAMAKKSNPQ